MPDETPAHDQAITHRYVVHYPAHEPRETDPHYGAFEAYRRAHAADARCAVAASLGTDKFCAGKLELHHKVVEFSLLNGVDAAALERMYPGITKPDQIAAWGESAENLVFLCVFHHRGHGGAHTASASDFAAEYVVPGLIG